MGHNHAVWSPAAVFFTQFLATLLIGFLLPLGIAFQSWRKTNLVKIPFTQSAILAALSLFLMFVFPLPLIGMGVAYLGTKPEASFGITVGWALVAIIYWPTMKWLFEYLKKRKKQKP